MSIEQIKTDSGKLLFFHTAGATLCLGVVDDGYLGQVYLGKRIPTEDVSYLLRTKEPPFVPSVNEREHCSFNDCFPFAYGADGLGDYRDGAFAVHTTAGHSGAELKVTEIRTFSGKPKLPGLPATFAKETECETAEITLKDPVLSLSVTLVITAFSKLDVFTQSVRVTNEGKCDLYLDKVMSICVTLEGEADLLTLHGSWARERHMNRRPVTLGRQSTSSVRGESGHQDHPFMALLSPGAGQETGEVIGLSFIYSGNFLAQAEKNQFDSIRAIMGINPAGFCWKLSEGESFTSPEAVMVYSRQGLGGMSRTFHDLYREHLIRSPFKDKERPVLINNWEATYFDFNEKKLLEIAKEAGKLGIEMLVMDDGWFGKRSSDDSSLGDWFVNEEKLKGGLPDLVKKVNELGMKFGIWFEPEMISPRSELFEAHPDWAIQIPGRKPVQSRAQLVLDITRQEVRDHVFSCLKKILDSAPIAYVKWDMNRQLTDIGSLCLPPDRQGELFHRYVLGVYELQERLITTYPELLLENCSGGGARFDPGMLYFSPQIWCSDDTDAIERLSIQESTALVYPLSTMGAHVSVCPNHSVGRTTPFETRALVALSGTFGYELDVTKLSEEEKQQIPGQIALYHRFGDLIRKGDYYRLSSYQTGDMRDAYMVVRKDHSEAFVAVVNVLGRPNTKSRRLRLLGLDPDALYEVEQTGQVLSGETLMSAGLLIPAFWGDFGSRWYYLKEKH